MDMKSFIESTGADFSTTPASEATIQEAERMLNISFGPQLKEYLSQYGYLGCGGVEFYGINERQKLRSDLVTQTQYLHKYFPATYGFVAFENLGEGAYALVDSMDIICIYVTEALVFIDHREKLSSYILRRFQEAINL